MKAYKQKKREEAAEHVEGARLAAPHLATSASRGRMALGSGLL